MSKYYIRGTGRHGRPRVVEKLGTEAVRITLDGTEATVATVLDQLRRRGNQWAHALDDGHITSDLNTQFVTEDDAVKDGDELAIAPINKGIARS